MQITPDRTISCTKDFVINSSTVGSEVSFIQLATRVTNLESSNSGSTTLLNYTSEPNAFFGGVTQGSDYLKNGVKSVVQKNWRPTYEFKSDARTHALTFTSSPSVTYNYMSLATAWTIEAYVCPTTFDGAENYFLDLRNSSSANGGFALGIYRYIDLNVQYNRPVVFSEGTATETGNGAVKQAQSGPTNNYLNSWAHVAYVKLSTDNTKLYMCS